MRDIPAKGRATARWLTLALGACCCGGTIGFVAPSTRMRWASALNWQRPVHRFGAVAAPTARPRALPRLFSSKGPPKPSGGADIMDSLTGNEREMSTEEKIAALQREVQAQARVAEAMAEEEESVETGEEEGEEGSMKSRATRKSETPSSPDSEPATEFVPPEGFVDEGKNILWPNPRRAAQLTLLAVVAQIAFVVYIITLNSFLNSFPTWFGKFVDLIKSSEFTLPSL
ncbi:unnamed protein product [Ascophyllum nodosum]